MTRNNHPDVRVSLETGLIWEFIAPSSATTCSEQAEEMVQFCRQLYDCFGEFLVPIEVNYEIKLYEQDTTFPPASEKERTVSRELRNEQGIHAPEFIESTVVNDPGVRYITRIPFNRNRYRVHWDGTDQAVEQSDCIRYQKGEPRPELNKTDPLCISANYRRSKNYPSVTTDHVLTVTVSMKSDLWLRKTENGQRNRAYLVEFFEEIADAISTVSIQRDKYATSDFWNDLSVYSDDDNYIELVPEAIY